jgi:hypothetical protein
LAPRVIGSQQYKMLIVHHTKQNDGQSLSSPKIAFITKQKNSYDEKNSSLCSIRVKWKDKSHLTPAAQFFHAVFLDEGSRSILKFESTCHDLSRRDMTIY